MKTTLKEFYMKIALASYEYGEYRIIRNSFKEKEIQAFIDCFLAGTEVLSNGENGKAVALKGMADDDKGATGDEILELHDYQLYDYSAKDGKWVVVTFTDVKKLEEFLVSEAGYLNYFGTQMLVFKDGVEAPFDIMFNGNEGITVAIDKDSLDAPLNIAAMKDKIYVRWVDPKERLPLTDEDVEAYKQAMKEKEEKENA